MAADLNRRRYKYWARLKNETVNQQGDGQVYTCIRSANINMA